MRSLPKFLAYAVVWATAIGLLREVPFVSSSPMLPFRVGALLAKPADTAIQMPLAHVRRRQIAETWHAARGKHRLHEGEDIFAPAGTPVYSATDGIVVRVGDAGIGGNAVSVLGAGGVVYYYAHLSRFAEDLHSGQEVTPQSVIGYVGNTGNARYTPSHLHFGVYGRSGAIDPLPLLLDREPRREATPADAKSAAPAHSRIG